MSAKKCVKVIGLFCAALGCLFVFCGCVSRPRDISKQTLTDYFNELGWEDVEVHDFNRVLPSHIEAVRKKYNSSAQKISNQFKIQVVFGSLGGKCTIGFVPSDESYEIETYQLSQNKAELYSYAKSNVENFEAYVFETRIVTSLDSALEYKDSEIYLALLDENGVVKYIVHSDSGVKKILRY